MPQVLIVEDDNQIRTSLVRALSEQGHAVSSAHTAMSGLRQAVEDRPHVVVLDLGLPDLDGREVLRMLRAVSRVPVIVATARDDEEEIVRVLDAGADDYLIKPFAFRELVARVRALARRQPVLTPIEFQVADLHVDLPSRAVTRGGVQIRLTAKEFSLLEFFVTHVGTVVDRASITAHVWDENHDPYTNVLEVLIRRLRRKIDDDFEQKLIHTMRGAGYRFGP